MKLLVALSLLAAPAFAGRTAAFRVGARVIRSATVSARIDDGRVRVENRGPLPVMRIEPAGQGSFRVTLHY